MKEKKFGGNTKVSPSDPQRSGSKSAPAIAPKPRQTPPPSPRQPQPPPHIYQPLVQPIQPPPLNPRKPLVAPRGNLSTREAAPAQTPSILNRIAPFISDQKDKGSNREQNDKGNTENLECSSSLTSSSIIDDLDTTSSVTSSGSHDDKQEVNTAHEADDISKSLRTPPDGTDEPDSIVQDKSINSSSKPKNFTYTSPLIKPLVTVNSAPAALAKSGALDARKVNNKKQQSIVQSLSLDVLDGQQKDMDVKSNHSEAGEPRVVRSNSLRGTNQESIIEAVERKRKESLNSKLRGLQVPVSSRKPASTSTIIADLPTIVKSNTSKGLILPKPKERKSSYSSLMPSSSNRPNMAKSHSVSGPLRATYNPQLPGDGLKPKPLLSATKTYNMSCDSSDTARTREPITSESKVVKSTHSTKYNNDLQTVLQKPQQSKLQHDQSSYFQTTTNVTDNDNVFDEKTESNPTEQTSPPLSLPPTSLPSVPPPTVPEDMPEPVPLKSEEQEVEDVDAVVSQDDEGPEPSSEVPPPLPLGKAPSPQTISVNEEQQVDNVVEESPPPPVVNLSSFPTAIVNPEDTETKQAAISDTTTTKTNTDLDNSNVTSEATTTKTDLDDSTVTESGSVQSEDVIETGPSSSSSGQSTTKKWDNGSSTAFSPLTASKEDLSEGRGSLLSTPDLDLDVPRSPTLSEADSGIFSAKLEQRKETG